MNEAFAVFAICFCIFGWGIPVYGPSLLMGGVSRWDRIFAGASMLVWAGCLSYAVNYVLGVIK